MSSVIYFRMHHGKNSEQINFEGAGLKLLELKKAIVEKKSISGSLDFDLKVLDENDPKKGIFFKKLSLIIFVTSFCCRVWRR